MEFLGKQAFENQHKESVFGNPDMGFFDKKTLEDFVDQNLDMILVEMKVEAFVPKAAKGSVHQCYNQNQDKLDSIEDIYNLVVAATSHNMVFQLVNDDYEYMWLL